jgi:hypothetical protein
MFLSTNFCRDNPNATLTDTYTTKILVQQLNITMNNFKGQQFIVFLFNSTTEIETSISEKQNTVR